VIPISDREETVARVKAYKVRVACARGDSERAQLIQGELEALGASTKDPNVYAAMQGGRGALLYYQNKYDEASGALQQDADDVFSRLLLAWCYEHHDGKAASEVLKGSLIQQHTMDIDLALVQRELTGGSQVGAMKTH